jgi:hypothetical protein
VSIASTSAAVVEFEFSHGAYCNRYSSAEYEFWTDDTHGTRHSSAEFEFWTDDSHGTWYSSFEFWNDGAYGNGHSGVDSSVNWSVLRGQRRYGCVSRQLSRIQYVFVRGLQQ